MPVEPLLERQQLVDGLEPPNPQQQLLEGADEALCTPVSLRRPHKAGAGPDAEKRQLVQEMAADVLQPVVVAQGQPRGNPLDQLQVAAGDRLFDAHIHAQQTIK